MHNEKTNSTLFWISPELNHYRIPGFELVARKVKKMIVLSGKSLNNEGHISKEADNYLFTSIKTDATYRNFSRKLTVYKNVLRIVRKEKPSRVIMPIEMKFFCTIAFILMLRYIYGFKLFSYNHDLRLYKTNTIRNIIIRFVSQVLFSLYDGIIFYTKEGMEYSIGQKIISREKCYYAGNTIDTSDIINTYREEKNFREKNIVFIGRIVAKRRLELLFDLCTKLKNVVKECRLYVIGEGPLLTDYREKFECDDIVFVGGTTDEKKIAGILNKSLININTGTTGLSVLHCFSYGIPVIAYSNITHPPEIDYIRTGYNGYLLKETDIDNNIILISNLLNDEKAYREISNNAVKTAESAGIENWSQNIINALWMN